MWTKEQEMAINKKHSNILVSASAGSGKTAILVERVISTCIREKIDIDRLLVVTFTNASATELKERLINAIYKELKDSPYDKFLRRQLNLINRANITTIHSFCLNLIRSNFYILDIDPNFRICDEIESKLLKNKAVQKVIEKRYEEYNKELENGEVKEVCLYDILELFSQREDTMMEELLKIYNFSLSFPYPLEFLKNSIELYKCDDLNKDLYNFEYGKIQVDDSLGEINILKKRCETFLELLHDEDGFEKYIEVIEDDIRILDNIINESKGSWDTLFYKLNSDSFKKNPRYNGTNVELKESVMYFRNKVLKESIKKMLLNVYAKSSDVLLQNKIAYNYLAYIYSLLKDVDIEYAKLKNKKNVLDFSDIEHLTLRLLVKKDEEKIIKTDIAKNLMENFYEVYTDEYQDTSYVQEAILSAISNSNNRFMVGDIKQSIYKFRQAMPDIFNKKYLEYNTLNNVDEDINECKIILDKNFRSRKTLLDSINFIFEKIMSMKIGDCNYSKDETLKAGNTQFKDFEGQNYLTEINIIDLEKSSDNTDSFDEFIEERKEFEIEAIAISNKIKELIENFKVFDLKTKKFRNACYKDIVILLRSAKDKSLILEKVFKYNKIPVFSDSSSGLLESDEVRFVISFLRVLDNPLQDIHLASVMFSIIGGFSLDELVKIRGNDKNINFYYNLINKKDSIENLEYISDEDSKLLSKITSFLDTLKKFNEYKYIFNISELITRIYKETNIYYEFAMEENANIRKANLNMLIDLAIKFEKNENKTLASYIEYIDNMKSKSDSLNSAKIIGENEDVVRIMTIHKSKGLEFPIVILSDSNKKYNFKDKSSTMITHHRLGIGINIVNKEHLVSYPSVIKKVISSAIDMETRSEELRMLYVALTRAKEKLIVFSTVNDYTKFKSKELVLYEGKKIDPYLISKNNSYFQNIHMCLDDASRSLFNTNVISAKYIIDTQNESCNSGFNNREKLTSFIDYDNDIDDTIIKEYLDHEYRYIDYTKAEKRISVTSLKENQNLEQYEEEKIENKYPIDEVLLNKTITPARKGTLTHFIIENLDFNIRCEHELVDYLEKLVSKGIISKDDINNIDLYSIIRFLNSNLANKIRSSKYVRQEEEFIFKDEEISISQIQGIIDLYFINENSNIELVDFKTDRLKTEKEFIDRYKIQIDLYSRALEKITGKKVEKRYIYSFNLNKEINL